eukprot:31264_1
MNSKLDELRVFLIDIPEATLLNLLAKSDLDIRRAVNLHFAQDNNCTPNPSPIQQIKPPSPPSALSSINHNINNNAVNINLYQPINKISFNLSQIHFPLSENLY